MPRMRTHGATPPNLQQSRRWWTSMQRRCGRTRLQRCGTCLQSSLQTKLWQARAMRHWTPHAACMPACWMHNELRQSVLDILMRRLLWRATVDALCSRPYASDADVIEQPWTPAQRAQQVTALWHGWLLTEQPSIQHEKWPWQ